MEKVSQSLLPFDTYKPSVPTTWQLRSPVMTSSSIAFDSLYLDDLQPVPPGNLRACYPDSNDFAQKNSNAFDPCKIQLLTRPLLAITIELTGFCHAPIPPKTSRRRVFVVARGDYSSEPKHPANRCLPISTHETQHSKHHRHTCNITGQSKCKNEDPIIFNRYVCSTAI